LIKLEKGSVKILLFMEIILSLSLTYYYLVHAFMFWRTQLLSFNIAYIVQILFFILPFGLLIFWRYRENISLFEYSLIITIVLYSVLSTRWRPDAHWYRDSLHWSIMGIGLGVFISREKLKPWVFWIPLIVITITILYNILVLDVVVVSKVFAMNRNRYAMILVALGFLGLTNYSLNERLDTFPAFLMAFITFGLSYYSRSRAALLVTSIMTVFVFGCMAYSSYKRSYNQKRVSLNIRIAVLAVLLLALVGLIIYITKNSRLGTTGIKDVSRKKMYQAFFKELNFKTFLIGFDTVLVTGGFKHVHNSFFQAIIDVGIGSLYLFFQFIMASWYYVKQRSSLLVILGLIFIYSLVDHIIYVRFFDIVLFPLIISAFYRNRTFKAEKNNFNSAYSSTW
jgi:hypothetical protein